MRAFLKTLQTFKIIKIARDLGFTGFHFAREDAIEFIVNQAKGYRWNVEDLKSRYKL